jgi:hypothetical protein
MATRATSDKAEKGKLVLAARLRTLHAAGFLEAEDVVRHLQRGKSLVSCIVNLAAVVGFDKIYGDLFDRLADQGKKNLTLATWRKALLGEIALVEELIGNIREDDLPLIFKFWLVESPERATWEQLVNASPYAVLRAWAAEGDQRADEAAATVVEAEDIDEEVEVVPAGEPTDGPTGE